MTAPSYGRGASELPTKVYGTRRCRRDHSGQCCAPSSAAMGSPSMRQGRTQGERAGVSCCGLAEDSGVKKAPGVYRQDCSCPAPKVLRPGCHREGLVRRLKGGTEAQSGGPAVRL